MREVMDEEAVCASMGKKGLMAASTRTPLRPHPLILCNVAIRPHCKLGIIGRGSLQRRTPRMTNIDASRSPLKHLAEVGEACLCGFGVCYYEDGAV